jgi:hypothetical protein
MMSISRLSVFAFATLGFLAVSSLAIAQDDQDRSVRIINNTGHVMEEFHASNVANDDWGDDILGVDELEDGQSTVIDFDDATGHCKFDFKAVFDDGTVDVKHGINVCKIDTYSYE